MVGKNNVKVPPHSVSGLPPGWAVSHEVTFTTVDSGACDSVAPPISFGNTEREKHEDYGKKYGACGGETITNLGVKSVKKFASI